MKKSIFALSKTHRHTHPERERERERERESERERERESRGCSGHTPTHWVFKNPLWVRVGTEMRTQYLPAH